MEIRQYEIFLLNLDPTVGSEMKKVRPCVVISPNEMNRYLQTVVIAPITSSSKPYPTRVEITLEEIKGWIVLDQIRSVDRIRIIRSLGRLTEKEIDKVKSVIRETYVD
ncbi:MAG: type II toxin-antitoxin system PemK/MazF family toxin [Bacteroidales bacterium]|nr:type II toxin-antitoxin system PemK/MazF family toxin [Bacteroidales bacterium]